MRSACELEALGVDGAAVGRLHLVGHLLRDLLRARSKPSATAGLQMVSAYMSIRIGLALIERAACRRCSATCWGPAPHASKASGSASVKAMGADVGAGAALASQTAAP